MDRKRLEATLYEKNRELRVRRAAKEVGRGALSDTEYARLEIERRLEWFKNLLGRLGPADPRQQETQPAEVRIRLGRSYAEQFGGIVENTAVVRAHTPRNERPSFQEVAETPALDLAIHTTFNFGPAEYPDMHELASEHLSGHDLPDDREATERLLHESFDTVDMLWQHAGNPTLNPQFIDRTVQSRLVHTP